MSLVSEEVRAKAEIYYGDELGREKTQLLLKEVGLPSGLLPLKDIVECGYVVETGFLWVRQKRKVEHLFEKIGRLVTYNTEITAYSGRKSGRITKLTGVKSKELMIWLTVNEIFVDNPSNPSTGKLTCKTPTGLFRVFPASAFEINEENKKQ